MCCFEGGVPSFVARGKKKQNKLPSLSSQARFPSNCTTLSTEQKSSQSVFSNYFNLSISYQCVELVVLHTCLQRSLVSCRCGFRSSFLSGRTERCCENPANDTPRTSQCNLQFVRHWLFYFQSLYFSIFFNIPCLHCVGKDILFCNFWF